MTHVRFICCYGKDKVGILFQQSRYCLSVFRASINHTKKKKAEQRCLVLIQFGLMYFLTVANLLNSVLNLYNVKKWPITNIQLFVVYFSMDLGFFWPFFH